MDLNFVWISTIMLTFWLKSITDEKHWARGRMKMSPFKWNILLGQLKSWAIFREFYSFIHFYFSSDTNESVVVFSLLCYFSSTFFNFLITFSLLHISNVCIAIWFVVGFFFLLHFRRNNKNKVQECLQIFWCFFFFLLFSFTIVNCGKSTVLR